MSVRKLLSATFAVGALGFGGGAALIPIMEREFVQRHKLATDDAFTAHTIIANVTPGAQPVKMSAMVGTHVRPTWAPTAAALTVALPGTLGTVLLLMLFTALGASAIRVIEFAALGISAFIAVLLIHYIGKVLRTYHPLATVILALLTFAAVGGNQAVRAAGNLLGTGWTSSLPQLSAVQVILLAVAGVAVLSFFRRGQSPSEPTEPPPSSTRHTLHAAAVLALIALMALGVAFLVGAGHVVSLIGLSTLSSFGGGAAYIGVADGFFVSSGIVPASEFYGQMVPVANALPGPVLIKLASAVGYGFGYSHGGVGMGVLIATLGFLVAVCSCSALALAFLAVYEKASNSPFVRLLGPVVLPVICGLLLMTMTSMLNASVDIAHHAGVSGTSTAWVSIAGVVLLWVVQRRWHPHDLVLILGAGGVSLATMLLLT